MHVLVLANVLEALRELEHGLHLGQLRRGADVHLLCHWSALRLRFSPRSMSPETEQHDRKGGSRWIQVQGMGSRVGTNGSPDNASALAPFPGTRQGIG